MVKVSPEISSLLPYVPGKPIAETQREYGLEEVFKLASNENPFGTSAKVLSAIQKAASELNRYPDPAFFDLKNVMGQYYRVEPSQMTFGNGSNELIDLLIRVFCEPGDSILTSKGAFIAYKICAQAARVKTLETPLTRELKFDVDQLISTFEKAARKPKILFVANPNNPTGTYLTSDQLTTLFEYFKSTDTLVVMDEAYCEYVRATDFKEGLTFQNKYPNIIVLRTLSKIFGLAGLRLGILIAHKEIVDYIDRVRNPFNVNHLAQVAAMAAVADQEYIRKSQKNNWAGLDFYYQKLDEMKIKYYPSQGNFVLIDTEDDSDIVYKQMLKRGVILRPVKPYGLNTHLRITVGLPHENEIAIKGLKDILLINHE